MARISKLLQTLKTLALVLVLASSQTALSLSPLFTQKAYAAGTISFGSQFENQTYPNNPNDWTTGQLDNYSEGDYVNFRFQLEASDSTGAGSMFIEFDLSSCNFFTNYFELVSTTPNIASVTKGSQELINPNGNNNDYYKQNLNVAFSSAGLTTIIFTLQLSNTAGECSGSNTGVRLGVPSQGAGDFANAGAKTLPMSANSVLENPKLTITKTVTGGDAQPSDFYFTISPAINGMTEVHIPSGQNSVTINEVNPDGQFDITEHGPDGYSFAGGSGDSCVVSSNEGIMTATVEARTSNPLNATCNFSNQQDTGSLTITKNAIPDDSQQFSFTSDIPSHSTFTLNDDYGDTDSTPASLTVSQLATGEYTVTEDPQDGWYLDEVSCTNTDTEDVDLANRSVTVTVATGDSINCTFTNRAYGTIKVTKQTFPSTDNTEFTITALTEDGEIITAPEQKISNAQIVEYQVKQGGTYSVSETDVNGWDQDDSECQSLAKITFSNLVEECTIYNRKQPKLTLVKDVTIDDSNDDAAPGDFTLLLDGGQYNSSEFHSSDTPTVTYSIEYSVSEKLNEVFGYEFVKTECVDDVTDGVVGAAGTVTLNPGQEVTCTVYNDDIAPMLTLIKNVTNDYGDPANANLWTLTATPGTNGRNAPTISGDGNPDDGDGVKDASAYADLVYTLTEASNVTGYSAGSWACQNNSDGSSFDQHGDQGDLLTLAVGSDVTCTITNTAQAPQLTIIKQVVNDNGGSAEASDFTMTVDAINPSQESFPGADDPGVTITLDEGVYDVSEEEQTGYIATYSEDCSGAIAIGETKTCTITNDDEPGSITVIKNIDIDGDNEPDEQDVDSWLWTIDNGLPLATGSSNTQTVDAGTYLVSEVQQNGYSVIGVFCTGERQEGFIESASIEVTVDNGEEVICTFLNQAEPVLNLEKSNDSPDPVDNGDTVTYTLTVSLPEDSGVLFDTTVIDLPPEGFTYVPGSWSATKNGLPFTVPEPTYASPGSWSLGTLQPGDEVVLSYQATVGNSVFPGTYPDVAFATGCAIESEECSEDNTVYSNLSTENEPFVGTNVSLAGRVLGASDTVVLVNTGTPMMWVIMITSAILLAGGIMASRAKTTAKGGRR